MLPMKMAGTGKPMESQTQRTNSLEALNRDVIGAEIRQVPNSIEKGKAAGAQSIPRGLLKIAGENLIYYVAEIRVV